MQGEAMARALDVAGFILNYAESVGHPISNLKLQKILYFVHRDYYGKYNELLVDDRVFEAWHYGPVIPRVYYEYVLNGANPIINQPQVRLDLSQEKTDFLKEKIGEYAKQKPWVLVELSHIPNGAWKQSYNPNQREVIPNCKILEEARNVERK